MRIRNIIKRINAIHNSQVIICKYEFELVIKALSDPDRPLFIDKVADIVAVRSKIASMKIIIASMVVYISICK